MWLLRLSALAFTAGSIPFVAVEKPRRLSHAGAQGILIHQCDRRGCEHCVCACVEPRAPVWLLGAAGIFAPLVTGIIVDRTGSFSLAFIVSAVWAVVAMLAWRILIRRVATVQWPEELANRTFADALAA